jgi:SET domain-containing protein
LGESYLYTLSSTKDIDAKNMGSLMKLANNAFHPMTNCYAKVVLARNQYRITLFAMNSIEEGEELFFSYGYSKEKQ